MFLLIGKLHFVVIEQLSAFLLLISSKISSFSLNIYGIKSFFLNFLNMILVLRRLNSVPLTLKVLGHVKRVIGETVIHSLFHVQAASIVVLWIANAVIFSDGLALWFLGRNQFPTSVRVLEVAAGSTVGFF